MAMITIDLRGKRLADVYDRLTKAERILAQIERRFPLAMSMTGNLRIELQEAAKTIWSIVCELQGVEVPQI